MLGARVREVGTFALERKLVSIGTAPAWVFENEGRGLLYYGPDLPDNIARATTYISRILRGAKPADLPVEMPTKYELVINGKTARAIGYKIPPALLVRADRVIE